MRAIRIFVVIAFLTSQINAQATRELLGKVVKSEDQAQAAVTTAKVVLDEAGSQFEIKPGDNGLFHLFLPNIFRPGDEVTISVTAAGYAVYEPPGGKVRIPADLARTRVTIQLLPKGSPKFLSDGQLRALVERTAKESARSAAVGESKERPDPARYLREWAAQYGFTVEQVRAALDLWAADVGAAKADPYELALKAFARKNFGEARQQALDAATQAEADLAKLQKSEQAVTNRAIKDYVLAGDAAYNELDFESASNSYTKALTYAKPESNPSQWADLQSQIGDSQEQLISRSEGAAISRHAEAALTAYHRALEVYGRDTTPRGWARTQNNLCVVFDDLAERSEGPQAADYLQQAVAACHSALQVRTREQLPQGWAMTQNNLGNALWDLAKHVEGPQAADYLQQAVTAFRNALQVRTREQLPQDWAGTQNNLGVALSDLAKRSEGPQAADYLQQAVAACRSALQVYTREQLPQYWARTQNNLSLALRDLADHTRGPQTTDYLQQAVAACQSALQVYTREQLPQDWAATENNLCVASFDLGGRADGPQATVYLEQAVAACRSALQVYTREQLPQYWALTQSNLGVALYIRGATSEGSKVNDYLQQAVTAFRNALQVITETENPNQWGKTMHILATTYELEQDWSDALQVYQALLRHFPDNTALQAKLKELSDKH